MMPTLTNLLTRRVFTTCLFFTALATGSGCGDLLGCDVGATRCNDYQAEDCEAGDDGHIGPWWNSVPCGEGCVVLPSGATCVDSATPIDECAQIADGQNVCWSDKITTCQGGYPTDTVTSNCRAGGGVCVAADGQAFCAESGTPDPVCAGLTGGASLSVCEGAEAVACLDGYVTERTTCQGTCVAVNGGAVCVESSAPDPACANFYGGGDGTAASTTCEGQDQIVCEGGFVLVRTACAPSTLCMIVNVANQGPEPLCTIGTTPDPRCSAVGFCADNVAYACSEGYVVSETECGGGTCSFNQGDDAYVCQ